MVNTLKIVFRHNKELDFKVRSSVDVVPRFYTGEPRFC